MSDRMDAYYELMDRQILDHEGRMIGKVDDVELEQRDDDRLYVTALLSGPGALGPRFGGGLGTIVTSAWSRLSGRTEPARVEWSEVASVETVIRLAVGRTDGRTRRLRDVDARPGHRRDPWIEGGPAMSTRHQLNDLLGMHVRFADGVDGDLVTDVRLTPSSRVRGQLSELVVDGLVIGRRRPGTLFGYDRHPDQGPWLIRKIIRTLHRHSGYVGWDDVERVDWDARIVHLRTTGLRDLTAATDLGAG